MKDANISGYRYSSAHRSHAHRYLLPAVDSILNRLNREGLEQRCFDLGCGNGSVANYFTENGWDVTGVDPSVEGIKYAKQHFPDLKLFDGSAYDDLSAQYGQFPVLISLEVVEHVYAPRDYAKTAFDLLQRGGWQSFLLPIIATGRIWPWRQLARWTRTLPPCGITATSSSGR